MWDWTLSGHRPLRSGRRRSAVLRVTASLATASLASALWLAGAEAQPVTTEPRTSVGGVPLPLRVTLAALDDRALRDPAAAGLAGAGVPSVLSAPPPGFAPLIEVDSTFWAELAASLRLPPAALRADVDVTMGVVALRHSVAGVAGVAGTPGTAAPSWVALDEARAGLLARYVRLASRGSLDAEPTILEVMREMRRSRERVILDVAGYELEPRRWDQRLIWAELEQATAREVRPVDLDAALGVAGAVPAFFTAGATIEGAGCRTLTVPGLDGDEARRLTFHLVDGRSLQFVYVGLVDGSVGGTGLLVDVSSLVANPSTLATSLPGFEVPDHLGVLMSRIAATGGVPVADGDNERLADLSELWIPAGVGTVASAVPATPPSLPTPARVFNNAAGGLVAGAQGVAPTLTLAMLGSIALAVVLGAASRRRALH